MHGNSSFDGRSCMRYHGDKHSGDPGAPTPDSICTCCLLAGPGILI